MLDNIDLRTYKLTKLASEIEDTLAPLVYSQIQEQLPDIFDKIIGLELVEEENNGTKCLVIVSFNISGNYFIMPIIYLNGILKPLILLYNVKSQLFLPATKKIISFLNKPPVGVGAESVPDNKLSNAVSNPNLMMMLKYPLLSKYANLKSIFEQIFDYPSFKSLYKNASNKTKLAFLRKISADKNLALDVLTYYPEVKNIDIKNETKANEIKGKQTNVIYDPSPEYPTEINEAIYRFGYYIDVGDDLTTDVEPELITSNIKFMNPVKSGTYNLITSEGDLLCSWCLVGNNDVYVVDPETLNTSVFPRKSNLLLGEFISDDLCDLFENCIPICKVTKGTYIPIDHNGNIMEPPVYFEDGDISSYRKKIIINPKTTIEINELHDVIIFNKNTPALNIKLTNAFLPGNFNDYFRQLQKKQNVETVILNKEADDRYTLLDIDNHELFNKTTKEAFLNLVLDYKIQPKKAIDMMKKRGSFYLIKAADPKMVFPTLEITSHPDIRPPSPPSNYDPNVPGPAGMSIYLAPEAEPNKVEDDAKFGLAAANSGISKVLDSALIGILANSDNDLERNKEMLPILHKATHMLGVTLFSMWWKPNAYNDSFITEEFYSLEQNLLDVFKKLGEIALTITLNRKL